MKKSIFIAVFVSLLFVWALAGCTAKTGIDLTRGVSDIVVGQAGVADVLQGYVDEGARQSPPVSYSNQQLSDRFHGEFVPLYPGAPDDPYVDDEWELMTVAGAIVGIGYLQNGAWANR